MRRFAVLLLVLGIGCAAKSRAHQINWTNTAGGDWNAAQNWSPNQVPGSNDTAAISITGVNVTVSATNAVDLLTLSANSSLTVTTNGLLNILGNSTVSGVFTNEGTVAWVGGTFQLQNNGSSAFGVVWNQPGANWNILSDSTMPVYYGPEVFNNFGSLTKAAGAGTTTIGVLLNNNGTVNGVTGKISLSGGGNFSGNFQGLAVLQTTPATVTGTFSGVLNFGSDAGLASGSWLTVATNGALTIAGNTTLDGPLTNSGSVTWNGGSIQLEDNETSAFGAIWNLSGANFNIQCDQSVMSYYGSEQFHNFGTVFKNFTSGTTTMGVSLDNHSTVQTASGFINLAGGGALNGFFEGSVGLQSVPTTVTGTFSGTLEFNSGSGLSAGSWLTVSNVSSLNIAGNVNLNGVLTNAGIVNWQAGNIQLMNNGISVFGALWNQPGGQLYISCDQNMPPYYGGENFINHGTLLKVAGTGVTTIGVLLTNSGTIHAQSGTIQLNGGGSLGGTIEANTGAAAYVGSGTYSASGAQFLGPGSVGFSGGVPAVTGPVSGNINMYSGSGLGSRSGMTVASGATLNLLGNTTFSGILTNAGTVNWQAGGIQLRNDGSSYFGAIWNQPGATFNVQCDQIMPAYYGHEYVNNLGTWLKNTTTGTTAISILFTNSATLHAESGTIQLNGGGRLGGTIEADTGAAAYVSGGIFSASGAIFQGPGAAGFSNGTPTVVGPVAGAPNIYNGGGLGAGTAMTVVSGATLSILGAANLYGILTNQGTLLWQSGAFQLRNDGSTYLGAIWNEPDALFDIQCDQGMPVYFGQEQINNAGKLRKSVTTGTTSIAINCTNSGTVEAQTGLLNFQSVYASSLSGNITVDLAGTTPQTGFGQVQFSQPAVLGGGFTVALLNSFAPTAGNSFKVIEYPSATGDFSSMSGLDLGNGLRLDPGFGKTALTLTAVSYPITAQPLLTIHRANQGEFLFWPASFNAWQLQTATNLAPPDWQPVATGGNDTVILQTTLPAQFFRLEETIQ